MSRQLTHAVKMILHALGPEGYRVVHFSHKHYLKREKGEKAQVLGVCKPEEREIVYYKQDNYADALRVTLHELLHAAYPTYEEKQIESLTDELMQELWES